MKRQNGRNFEINPVRDERGFHYLRLEITMLFLMMISITNFYSGIIFSEIFLPLWI